MVCLSVCVSVSREGLAWVDINWMDNGECLDLIEKVCHNVNTEPVFLLLLLFILSLSSCLCNLEQHCIFNVGLIIIQSTLCLDRAANQLY